MSEVIHLANQAILAFHQIPSGFWQVLLASGILSPLLKVYKHVMENKRDKEIAETAMYLITAFAAFVVAFVQYMLTTHPGNPDVIALHTALLGFTMQPIYFLGVKPLWNWGSKKYGTAFKLAEDLKTASIPAGGLPIAGTSVSAESAQEALHTELDANQDNF